MDVYFLRASNVYCQIVLLSPYLSVPFTVFLPIFDFIIILNQCLCDSIFNAKKVHTSVKAKDVNEKNKIYGM